MGKITFLQRTSINFVRSKVEVTLTINQFFHPERNAGQDYPKAWDVYYVSAHSPRTRTGLSSEDAIETQTGTAVILVSKHLAYMSI